MELSIDQLANTPNSEEDLLEILARLGSVNPCTITIWRNIPITASLSIPANVGVYILNGGSFSVASTKLLTILGPLVTLPTSWWSGAGAVSANPSYLAQPPLSNRNVLINGNMAIFQRGTTAITADNSYGPADRWQNGKFGNTYSTSQGAFVSGDTLYDSGEAQYFQQIAVTSVANVANYTVMAQHIEDVRRTAGKTVTVSFWAKAAAGTPIIGVEVAQCFGTGGSPSANATGVGQPVTLSTTWAKYTKTFVVPSLNGKTLGTTANTSYSTLNFWLDAGANLNTRTGSIGQASKTVSIAQVQLEIGAAATPFEHRPLAHELALCQRYYEVGENIAYAMLSNASYILPTRFKVEKRVPTTSFVVYDRSGSPTISKVSKAENAASVLSVTISSTIHGKDMTYFIASTVTLTAGEAYIYMYYASSEF